MSAITLTKEQRLDIIATLRIRAHDLRQNAADPYTAAEFRDRDLAEANRLTDLALLLECKEITVAPMVEVRSTVTTFPPGSVRAAVAQAGDAWSLMHEAIPGKRFSRNQAVRYEATDEEIVRMCTLFCGMRRETMNVRAAIGLKADERW